MVLLITSKMIFNHHLLFVLGVVWTDHHYYHPNFVDIWYLLLHHYVRLATLLKLLIIFWFVLAMTYHTQFFTYHHLYLSLLHYCLVKSTVCLVDFDCWCYNWLVISSLQLQPFEVPTVYNINTFINIYDSFHISLWHLPQLLLNINITFFSLFNIGTPQATSMIQQLVNRDARFDIQWYLFAFSLFVSIPIRNSTITHPFLF